MASQVSNWLYEKKDYAIKALTNWVGTVYTGETAAEVLQKLSKESSVRVYNSTLYNDDGDFELIVRPYSRTLGGDLGSKTGCMTFNISSSHQASINGLYGAIDLDNVIYQVFKACGVIVEEDKLNHYRLAVRDRMGIGALNYYTGVVIKVSNGLLIGYVSKKVVQNIIDGMAEERMFGEESWTSELPPPNTTNLPVSGLDLSEAHNYLNIYNLVNKGIVAHGWNSEVYTNFVTSFNNLLSDISYDYVVVYVSDNSNTLRVNVMCFLISSDTFNTGSGGDTYVNLAYNTFNRVLYRQLYYNGGSNWGVTQYPTPDTGGLNIIGYQYGEYEHAGDLYIGMYSTLNSKITHVPPEGISFEENAVIPTTESHNINTVYPEWATTTNQTVSPNLNISIRTLIALSFTGDTQYNTQAGVITTNEMLHSLGVYVEATEEYIPANPEEGEDGEPIVIIPDAKPIPSDTPNEDYPDSVTPASKYMVSVWNMTDTMVQNFASALWSNTLWNAIKDFFTKPTDGVIALFTLYGVDVGTGASSQEIKIGGHGMGVSAIPVTTRYKTVDLGTVNVPEFYSNVEDYAPYSSAEIYLPFIGFCTVDVNEIMNSTVNIKYVFDMWTGSLVARIFVTRDGVRQELYNFTGSSSVQIPLTDRDYTSAISSLMLGSFETAKNVVISGAIAAAAGATGGAALLPAIGTGLVGSMNTLNNHTQGVKNRVQRSGSIGSIYGAMTNKKACIYVKRPVAYNANNYQHYYGFPANWTCTLRDCHGFTRVKDIHLDTVTCTDEERIEIERLLKQGVMM